jgi:hypothetical protein
METEPRGTGYGTAGLIEADDAHRAEAGHDYWDDSYIAGAFSAPGENGDWTLVLGFDGGLGITGAGMERLSQGGRVVSHSTNGGTPMHFFHWFEDPSSREGSTPDQKAAALALAERLTGVSVTESMLQDATYQLGLVPEQPAEEWTGVVIDISDARGERLHREWTYGDRTLHVSGLVAGDDHRGIFCGRSWVASPDARPLVTHPVRVVASRRPATTRTGRHARTVAS